MTTPRSFRYGVLKKAGNNLLSRYSHYHGPQVLNGRVRNGNGCGHLGMVTGKIKSDEFSVTSDKQERRLSFSSLVTLPSSHLYQMAAAGEFLVGSTEPESQANRGHPHTQAEESQCGQALGC